MPNQPGEGEPKDTSHVAEKMRRYMRLVESFIDSRTFHAWLHLHSSLSYLGSENPKILIKQFSVMFFRKKKSEMYRHNADLSFYITV